MEKQTRHLTVAALISALQELDPDALVDLQFYAEGRTQYERLTSRDIIDEPRDRRVILAAN